jgi:hypothetical protein
VQYTAVPDRAWRGSIVTGNNTSYPDKSRPGIGGKERRRNMVERIRDSEEAIEKYITGYYALNIHHAGKVDEPTGDWHGSIWEGIKEIGDTRILCGGKDQAVNTFPIWGSMGIYAEREAFLNMGIAVNGEKVYVADYYRAVLDLVFYNLKTYGDILNMNGDVDSFFDTDEQKKLLFEYIVQCRRYIDEGAESNLDKWIAHEMQGTYDGRKI